MEDLGYPFETLGSAKIVSWSGHSEDGVPTSAMPRFQSEEAYGVP
jgi:hypothetical protein